MFRWFEKHIAPFPDERERPPEGLGAFYLHYVRPAWKAFSVLLVVGFAGSLIEVSLMAFVGSLVDMMRASPDPATFFADHRHALMGMAFIALIARPIISTLHDLIKNQMITGALTARIRWQTHGYVLRQSLGVFQNDFAGRFATRIMQTGAAL